MADKMKKPDVRLEINGVKYGGWTKISIRRGIGQVAGTFELSITERWPGQPIPAKIELGASCVVTVDGAPVITGYVDDVAPSYNAASHTVSVTGRDKTCDLVDCCPPSTQLKGATLAAVAGRLRPRSASRWSTKRASASSPASRRTPAIPFSRRWSSLPGQRASCSRPTDAGGSSSAGQAKRKPPPSSNSARTSLKARASFPCATASRASPSSARRRRRRRGTARAPHSRKPW